MTATEREILLMAERLHAVALQAPCTCKRHECCHKCEVICEYEAFLDILAPRLSTVVPPVTLNPNLTEQYDGKKEQEKEQTKTAGPSSDGRPRC